MLHVPPFALRQFAFGAQVQVPIAAGDPQPVAETQHPVDLVGARAEDVQVDVGIRALEQAVLEPSGLADPQPVPGPFQSGQIRRLVGRVRHDQQDVDDWLGGEPRHRGRADVLDAQGRLAQGGLDPAGLESEQPGPAGVVLGEADRSVMRLQFTDEHFPEFGVASQAGTSIARLAWRQRHAAPLRPVGEMSE